MENINRWSEILFASLRSFGQSLMNAVPNIIGAIILLLIGWLVAKMVSLVTKKALKAIGFERVLVKLSDLPFFKDADLKTKGISIISRFVYWLVLLLFVITATETLGWTEVSEEISAIINYIPQLFSAIAIFIIGLYIAKVARDLIKATLHSLEIASAYIVSSVAFYIIVIIITITALNQVGIDTTILTSNFTIIIGAVMISFAVSFALGSRDILHNILSAIYSKKNFQTGDQIKIGNINGRIIKIDNISVVIKTADSEVIIPAKRLVSEQVEKLNTSYQDTQN